MARTKEPGCARCTVMVCMNRGRKASDGPLLEKAPAFCPMRLEPEALQEASCQYAEPAVREFARQASVQEFECYERVPGGVRTKIPRIEELIQFARKCGYQRLGLAYCGGLSGEAHLLSEILENHGFTVISVQCKTGAVPKESIGIRPEQKIGGPEQWETMCNPIGQAMVMNRSRVDLAVMLGLCLGHDTLFLKYCRVPVTVIAVKDRVFGHNPLAALYLASSPYYRRLMAKEE